MIAPRWIFGVLVSCSLLGCSDDGLAPQDTDADAATGLGDDDDGGGDDGDGATGGGDDGADDGMATGGLDDTGGEGTGADDSGGTDDGYCPDVEPWPRDLMLCQTADECPPQYTCDPNGPPDHPGCGACSAPKIPCTADDECTEAGQVCVPFEDPCACEPGVLGCAAPCREGSCAEGEACQPDGHCTPLSCETRRFTCDARSQVCDPAAQTADEHGCAPTPCDAGWTCEPGWLCEPADPLADPHGCLPVHCGERGGVQCEPNFECDPGLEGTGCTVIPCVTTADCDCGTCVEGVCRAAPGVCVPPPPP